MNMKDMDFIKFSFVGVDKKKHEKYLKYSINYFFCNHLK